MATHLITGGAGFIGSHLADYLVGRGEDVVVIDNFTTGARDNIRHLEGQNRFQCWNADVRNEGVLEEVMSRVDYVHHLAASVGVRLIIRKPTESLINNIMGTECVLRCAARHGKPVLITSTSEVYGKSSKKGFSEDDDRIMGPTDKARWAYANSKATDEFLAIAYHRESGLPAVVVRLFNTVGPRQSGEYGMVIPNFVRQALQDLPLTVHGDGSQTRCFCHIDDVVPALVRLVEHPDAYGDVYNLGSDEEVSIQELAERVIEQTGSASVIRHVPYDQAYPSGFEDMARRVPDLRKIGGLIGYRPQRTLRDILNDVIREFAGKAGTPPV